MKERDGEKNDKPNNRKSAADIDNAEVKDKRRHKWIEIASAILLSLAMIASAWCAYQAARWSGVQTNSYNEANAARATANEDNIWSVWRSQSDIIAFNDYQLERLEGNQEAMDYFRENIFSDELYAVFDQWEATNPYNNPDAPNTPFDMDEYQYPWYKEALAEETEAQEKVQEARAANQQSDNYVLLTVIFATVLFFAGISTKFDSINLKMITLAAGTLVFIVSVIALSFQAVH
jgi:hypothetical protein